MRILIPALLLAPFVAAHADDAGLANSYQPAATPAGAVVYKSADKTVSLGANAQFFAVPLLGADALSVNGDVSDAVGLVARRASLAVEAKIGSDLEFYLNLNPLKEKALDDLRLRWLYRKNMALGLGVAQVPYSRSLSESSSTMRFMERPISTGDAAIGDRVGITAEGHYYGGKLGYLLGVYNGGPEINTNDGGLAYGARLESAPLGPLAVRVPKALRLRLGGGAVYDMGPTVTTTAFSGDLTLEGAGGWRVYAEFLMDSRSPLAVPELPPTLSGTVDRQVMLAEASCFVWNNRLEVVGRFEMYDNNKALTDHGDQQVITAGANLYFKGHDLKLQTNYIHRSETAGASLDNDALLIGVAAAL